MIMNQFKARLRSQRNSKKITQKEYQFYCKEKNSYDDKKKLKRSFSFLQVLTITSGKFLSSMDEIYDILGYLTGDTLYTHQLPMARDAVTAFIRDKYPVFKDERMFEDLQRLCDNLKNKDLKPHHIKNNIKSFGKIWEKNFNIKDFIFKSGEFSKYWKAVTSGIIEDLEKMVPGKPIIAVTI